MTLTITILIYISLLSLLPIIDFTIIIITINILIIIIIIVIIIIIIITIIITIIIIIIIIIIITIHQDCNWLNQGSQIGLGRSVITIPSISIITCSLLSGLTDDEENSSAHCCGAFTAICSFLLTKVKSAPRSMTRS